MKIPPAILGALTLAALSTSTAAFADAVADVVTPMPAATTPGPNGKPVEGMVAPVIQPQAASEVPVICPKNSEPNKDAPSRHYDDCPGCGLG
ncbi:MAG: hypothetical protein ACI8RZ_005180 [Myxococcota bacterium]|jgi:hypothetical protein